MGILIDSLPSIQVLSYNFLVLYIVVVVLCVVVFCCVVVFPLKHTAYCVTFCFVILSRISVSYKTKRPLNSLDTS